MTKVITTNNLTKTFKVRTNQNFFKGLFDPEIENVEAVSDVSFEVFEGETLAFLGPNGAGKTTTTKMLTGLIYPTSGTAEVLGFIPTERKYDFLRQIGLVMGNKTGMSWDLTAEQGFEFTKEIYKIPEDKYKNTLGKLTELLDITKHMYKQIRKLSLGERMKVELINAILHNPKILFLDEPTIGLDITSKKNIRKFLRDLQKESNITMILTSHDMDDVEKVCDRVLVINKGQKVYDDQLTKLVTEYRNKKYIKFFVENGYPDTYFDYAEELSRQDSEIVFEVDKENSSRLISDMLDNANVYDIDILAVPLEEIIEDIFERTK